MGAPPLDSFSGAQRTRRGGQTLCVTNHVPRKSWKGRFVGQSLAYPWLFDPSLPVLGLDPTGFVETWLIRARPMEDSRLHASLESACTGVSFQELLGPP